MNNSIQVSRLCCSWSGDNSCGIETPYLQVLPGWCRCVSTAMSEHRSYSAKNTDRVVNRGSSSISCFKRSIFTFCALPLWDKWSSWKLPFFNRWKQCCAVRMESASLPIVPYLLLVASSLKRNWWSRSNRTSLSDIFICNSRSTFISIIWLFLEKHSYPLYKLLAWNLLDYCRKFSKKCKNFLATEIFPSRLNRA